MKNTINKFAVRAVKIGIPSKGRLFDGSLALLKNMGIVPGNTDRHLTFAVQSNKFLMKGFYLRPEDIARFVESGKLDMGIVGEDKILEKKFNLSVISKLGFAKCSLVVAIPEHSQIMSINELAGKTVATSYPNITKEFFKGNGINVDIVNLSGSVETAPYLGIADATSDITETGQTLKANNLRVIERVRDFEAVLISNNAYRGKQLFT